MGPDCGPGAGVFEIAWIPSRSAGLPGSPQALLAHQGRDSVLVAGGEPVVDVPAMLAALRLLCDRRDEVVAARTQAVCRLCRLLAELSGPGGSAVCGLPGRVAGLGWVVVVPCRTAFSPGVILADMQLEEGGVGEAEPA
jgi:hypothetical protein